MYFVLDTNINKYQMKFTFCIYINLNHLFIIIASKLHNSCLCIRLSLLLMYSDAFEKLIFRSTGSQK